MSSSLWWSSDEMEPLIFIGSIVAAVLLHYHMYTRTKRKIEPPKTPAQIRKEQREEWARADRERHKQNKRRHEDDRERQREWDEKYFSQLPPEQHPDYIKPGLFDEELDTYYYNYGYDHRVEGTQYISEDGYEYTVSRITKPTPGFVLVHKGYKKFYPYKEWKQFLERREIAQTNREYEKRNTTSNKYEILVGSHTPGQCSECGQFKQKTEEGYYVCKQAYYARGWWNHKH